MARNLRLKRRHQWPLQQRLARRRTLNQFILRLPHPYLQFNQLIAEIPELIAMIWPNKVKIPWEMQTDLPSLKNLVHFPIVSNECVWWFLVKASL